MSREGHARAENFLLGLIRPYRSPELRSRQFPRATRERFPRPPSAPPLREGFDFFSLTANPGRMLMRGCQAAGENEGRESVSRSTNCARFSR